MSYEAISGVKIALMLFMGVLCFALPFGTMLYLGKKRMWNMNAFLIGCAVFIFVVLVLEPMLHSVVLNSTGIQQNLLLYSLYGGLAAGLFEETGRLLAFRFFMKKQHSLGAALSYGAGHGGAEAVLIGSSLLQSGVLALQLNGNPALISEGENAAAYLQSYQTLQAAESLNLVLSGVERVLTFALQMALSVLVMTAVVKKGKMWAYWLAVLLHTVVDAVCVPLSKMIALPLVMLLLAVMTAGAIWLTVCVYKRVWPVAEASPAAAGSAVLDKELPLMQSEPSEEEKRFADIGLSDVDEAQAVDDKENKE